MPDWPAETRALLRELALSPTRENEIVEELSQHLDDCYRELIAKGYSESEACRSALGSLSGERMAREIKRIEGSREQEPSTMGAMNGGSIMSAIWQDIRCGVRSLKSSPGFTAVALITLALGIGGSSAIFSIVNAVLFRQMPFSNPDRLVWIWATHTDRDKAFFSIPDFQDISNQNTTLDAVSGIAGWAANLTGAGEPERLYGLRETANTFGVLGTEAGIGRVLQDADARPDSTPVVVLTYKTWKSRFGADYGLVGRTITLNGDSYTVVGVLTPNFVFPRQPDAEMVAPLKLESDPRRSERGSNFIRAFARLKAGATVAQARIDLAAITGRLRQMYPETNSKYTAPNVLPLFDELVGNYRPALLMLLGAVGVVLLIGCSNLASLLLARASARRSEIAIRTALGADRGRLLRQLLTESLMLALAGGLTGLILAWRSIPLLLAIAPGEMARGQVVHVDGAVLAFALLVSLISAILFGLAPALELSKVDLNEAIKAGNRGSCDSGRSNKARKSLMALEIALSLVLLINAGLLIKGFTRLTAVDPGFKSDHRLIVQLSLPNSRYATAASVKGFYQKLTPRLRAMPGVEDVGLVSVPPLSGLLVRSDFSIVGRPALTPEDMPGAQTRWVSPGYFKLIGIPIKTGRDFSEHDEAGGQGVVLIDEATAKQFLQGLDPIGAHITIDDLGTRGRELEIVGITGNVKNFSLEESPLPTIYFPFYQIPDNQVAAVTGRLHLVLRSKSDPLGLGMAVRQAVQSVDNEIPASYVKSMDQYLSAAVSPRRFNLFLLSIFAVLALLLAALGVYAVVSYWVSQRTNEIGIRLALGASRGDILRLMTGAAIKPVLLGLGFGLAVALSLTSVMSGLLFEVKSTDLVTYVLVSTMLVFVALLATYIPSRRSTKVDPATVLRLG